MSHTCQKNTLTGLLSPSVEIKKKGLFRNGVLDCLFFFICLLKKKIFKKFFFFVVFV